MGQGAGIPVVALLARELGASVGVAGLIVAFVGLGSVLGDLPAGRLVTRFGERRAIIVGSAIGAAGVSLVHGIGAAFDLACSYPAGQLMDRYGRRALAVPSLLVIAASFFALPFTHSFFSVTVVAAVMGIGNGLGNGVIMTLGADVAPAATRAEFLAVWRLAHDAGMFPGPLSLGGAAVVAPLGVGLAGLGVIAVTGAAMMWRHIPRLVPWPPVISAHSPAVSAGECAQITTE